MTMMFSRRAAAPSRRRRRCCSCDTKNILLLAICTIVASQILSPQGGGSGIVLGAFVSTPPISTRGRSHYYEHFDVVRTAFTVQTKTSSRLQMSTSTEQSSSSSSKVVYQKIVRPYGDLPPALFLAHLVEYLQDHFELPTNLPMVYEPTHEEENDHNDNNQAIVSWDSPLSSSPQATKLHVQVVGIYTDDNDSSTNEQRTTSSSIQSSVPNMAMVVVSKSASSSTIVPMMEGLFRDSEKRILRALDRGLDDFCSGKIKIDMNIENVAAAAVPSTPDNFKNVEEAIQAELMEQQPEKRSLENIAPEDVVIDTTSRISSEPETAPDVSKTDTPTAELTGVEYAVEAAKRAASLRDADKSTTTSNNSDGKEEFAVQAAKRIAAKRIKDTNGKAIDAPVKNGMKSNGASVNTPKRVVSAIKTRRSSGGTKFKATISTPEQRSKRKITAATTQTSKESPVSKKAIRSSKANGFAKKTKRSTKKAETKSAVASKEAFKTRKASEPFVTKSATTASDNAAVKRPTTRRSKFETKRKVNIRLVETEGLEEDIDQVPFEQIVQPNPEQRLVENTKKKGKQTSKKVDERSRKAKTSLTKEQMELDVVEAAQEVMSELASDGNDMTPQELLDDIVKFGREKEDEKEKGFASGAFEKAKELLRERKQKVLEKQNEAKFKEATRSHDVGNLRPDIADPPPEETSSTKELSADEELKQLFQAGERVAEGLIATTTAAEEDKETAIERNVDAADEKELEELLASEKTISSHARILDHELAELEVRINKSPGEELDGPRKNPMFDIFSGPEVYNPNVDPETAVNWPGAQPGTKDVRLPKELDEAVRQAKFATEILSKLKEVETEGKEGTKQMQYFVGDKELSPGQVKSLRQTVQEAAQIGLIVDPLELMAERSRLQMVLDELAGQPEERIQDIVSNYKDLLLSENFVSLIQERLAEMADRDIEALKRNDTSLEGPHELERELLGHLVVYAQLLLKEARALGAELEASQLEVVRSICEVAMDPSLTTEEETSMALTDAVRDMRPMLDDSFVAYLKYAVAEEEGRLARAGVLDDPAHNEWLFVLKIVQQGVYNEIAVGINRFVDHIWYVLRMETKEQRRALLKEFIDVMPTMDVRPFVQVVDNIVGALGDTVRGDFDSMVLGEMSNKLLQLHRDVHEMLPPERIQLMSRDADEWAAQQKQRLMEQRKITRQRLKAAQDTQEYDEEIRRRGEVERMT